MFNLIKEFFKSRCSISIKKFLAFLDFASECQSKDTDHNYDFGQKTHYVSEYDSTHYDLFSGW